MTWPVLFLSMLAGLVVTMPVQYGGEGLDYYSGLVISGGLAIAIIAGIVWLMIWLLRKGGLLHPLASVLGGIGLTGVVITALIVVMRVTAVEPPDWIVVLFLLISAFGFGVVAGLIQRASAVASHQLPET